MTSFLKPMGPKQKFLPTDLRQRSERWVFTLPRVEGDRPTLLKLANLQINPDVQYLAIGAEVGQGGYQHWQGACVFKHGTSPTGNAFKLLLNEETHVEAMQGPTKQAMKYCTKEGSLCFQKNLGFLLDDDQKVKKRIERAKEVKDKRDEISREITGDLRTMEPQEFAEKWPTEWLRNRSKCETFLAEAMGERATTWGGNLQAKNFWIWGKPGTGKSRWATGHAPPYQTYRKNANKWWDGYSICHHNTVIIEDYPCFPQGDCLQHHMKVWADRYPFTGEKKCGHLAVETGRFVFIVTSNYPIEKCFSHQEDVLALKRRFNEIEMTTANAPLVRALQPDYTILTTRNPAAGEEMAEVSQEEFEDLERAIAEARAMEAESEELEEEEGDENAKPKKGIRYPEEW
jgi:hypothetical protein